MQKNKRIRYYVDETKDDFQFTKTYFNVTVDENYQYLPKSKLFKITSFFLYYLVGLPLLWLYSFIILGVKVKGRKNLKDLKHTGYFIYSNHTHYADAWLGPVLVNFYRKRTYVIANKDAIQIPVVGKLTKALGALPVADTIKGLKNLSETVTTLTSKNKSVIIFPEAHIWHYYTKLRPFPLTSFKFPVFSKKPVVPVAVTYKKRKNFSRLKPRMIINIGSPIFPKEEFSDRENTAYLHDEVIRFIKEKVYHLENYAYYDYIKIGSEKFKQINNL